jgi:hypothetical protein
MKTKDDIRKAAMNAFNDQDHVKLFHLVQEAIALSDFHAAQENFAKVREQKLNDQVQRQTAMIKNLERTLWGK